MDPVHVIVAAGAGVLAGPVIARATRPWDAIPTSLAGALCGAGCAAMAARFDGQPVTVTAYCILVAALVALVWIDVRTHRLPREISYPAASVGGAVLLVASVIEDAVDRLGPAVLGAALATAILGLLFVVGRGGLGDGDVRLAPLLGMYLGYLDIVLVPVALLIAAVLGSVVAVIVLMRGGDRRSTIPFGPFLAAGTLAAVLM